MRKIIMPVLRVLAYTFACFLLLAWAYVAIVFIVLCVLGFKSVL